MDPIATVGTPNPAGQKAPGDPGGANPLSSDFETFLKMLTVQMQNQDPLNPVEATDFAVQLATFSSVEQQVQTNDLLSRIAAQMGAGDLAQMTRWVGMEARSNGPAGFDGAPLTLYPQPNLTADTAELVVKDDRGIEVQRLPVDPRADELTWAGVTADGAPLPSGQYSFGIVYRTFGQPAGEGAVDHYDRVVEVRADGGVSQLVMADGRILPVTDVSGVREPVASGQT